MSSIEVNTVNWFIFSTYEVEGFGNALEILSFKNGLCLYFPYFPFSW